VIEADDDAWPSWPAEGMTLERIHWWVEHEPTPISGLREDDDYRYFGRGPGFHKRWPHYRLGWSCHLADGACFLKRPFDFPDLGKRGWAMIFQNFQPPGEDCEILLGWVPPEREREVDDWIAFMNAETQRLLRDDAAEKAVAVRSDDS